MTIAEQKFRLRLWGVLVFLTVLLGLIAIYALTDSAPPRDTTFLIETVPVADRDSVLAGLEEIHRALPEETLSVVWNALRDLPGDVPLFALSVEGIWRMSPAERAALPEQFVENLARAFARLEATLSPLDEVLSRPQLGSDPWVVAEDSSGAFFDLRMVLSDRALLHRLQGDAAAASRELDRLRRMSSRFLFEGANLFEMLPAIHARLQCWQWAEDLLAQGELAPEVESQWLADRSVEEGLDELRSLLLATIYTRFRIDLSGVKSGEITTEFHPSTVSRYFKMNRTCESLSEGLHDLLDRARLPVPERTDEVLDWWHEGAELRMILRANAGEKLVPIALSSYAPILDKVDELLLDERAGRALLALRRYERTRGLLPSDWEALVEAVPGFDEVPIDPYADRPLSFDAKQRRIWSVGKDLVDDGAGEGDRVWEVVPVP